jgi:hypothetical protein
VLSPQGDTIVLRGAVDTTPAVCAPAKATAGAVTVTLTPSADVSVTLAARWATDAGEAVGEPTLVRQLVRTSGGAVTLPLEARAGAATMHICLRRAPVAADLHVTAWEIVPAVGPGEIGATR